MNIPKGYKLVPVETLKFALGLTRYGFKNRTDQEADQYAALKTITELLDAPAPQQPIYDEAKERSACRKSWVLRNKNSHFEPCPYPDYWAGWQSRAKSVEVGDE